MKTNKIENLVWIIFTTIGVLFTIIGTIACINTFNYEDKINTTGIITEIDSYRDSDGDRNYTVYVSYTVKGEEYESRLNSYSSNFYEGKEIEIYYDKDNPNKIGVKSLDLLTFIFPGIGLIFVSIGISGLFAKVNKRKKERNLKENGQCVYAKYVETVYNTAYSVNGRHPYNIICECDNLGDGKKYILKSKNIWVDPEGIIKEKNIESFPVYIDMNNIKQYVIDTNILTENVVDLS